LGKRAKTKVWGGKRYASRQVPRNKELAGKRFGIEKKKRQKLSVSQMYGGFNFLKKKKKQREAGLIKKKGGSVPSGFCGSGKNCQKENCGVKSKKKKKKT